MKKLFKLKVKKTNIFLTLICLISLLAVSCSEDTTPSLYDANKPAGLTPVITSVTPADSGLAGISEITITGSNFSAVKEENIVYFNGTTATILDASPTRLIVKAPNVVQDDMSLRISVYKVASFSNVIKYKLQAAAKLVYEFKDFEVPWGITTDALGNLYMSFNFQGGTGGTQILTPAGKLSEWAPRGSETFHSAIKWGPDGSIYAARRQKVIFKITAGAKPVTFVSAGLGVITDFDFDPDGNIWAGGGTETTPNDAIYRIKENKDVKAFPFVGNVKSVRIFKENAVDLYIYVAATKDNEQVIYRAQIFSADEIGSFEKYFSFTEVYGTEFPGVSVNAITFAEDGDMYVGTNMTDPITVIHPDKTYEPLYTGVLSTNVLLFAWGPGNTLYYTRGTESKTQVVFKVDMLKKGAPDYGRD
ncbi:MAG: IPT/TIG domain-containing protein [bacterium]